MKKLSIILLVLALAGGMAFGADLAIAGDVTFSTSFDLDTMSGGSDGDTNTLEYDASIVLISGGAASASGEGDVYAVLEVSVADWKIAVDEATAPALPLINAISIDTFKIVAGDVTVNLLGNTPVGNFVKYFDYTTAGTPDIDVAKIGLAVMNGGVDVTAGDITVGADLWIDGVTPATTYMVWGAYATDLAEGVKVSLAAGYDDAAGADAAAQISYASDAYTVVIGVDTADNFALYEVEADFDAVIDVVTVDANVYFDGATVYVADQNTIALEGLTLGLDAYYNDVKYGDYIAVEVVPVLDGFTLSLAGGFDYSAMEADALLKVGYAVSDATQVDARVGYDMATSFNVGATLTQTIEAGKIVAMFDYQADATIDASVKFSSTSLIDGAALAIGWAAEDVAADLGVITASVKVSL